MFLLGVTNYRNRNTNLSNTCYERETQRDLEALIALPDETSYVGNLVLPSGIGMDSPVYLFSELEE